VDNFLDLVLLYDVMASKNLFSGVASEGGSEAGPRAPETSGAFTRIEERDEQEASWGPRGLLNLQLLPYDYAAAMADRPVSYRVTSNRVMSQEDAGVRLRELMQHCGVQGQADGVQLAFHRALVVAHAVNSGSVLQPNRAVFQVRGGDPINFFVDVVTFLGDDTRRFFRAYADFTRIEIRRVYSSYRKGDMSFEQTVRDLQWVANDRGLHRFKDLVADSAEACTGLTRAEVSALGMAKQSIFAATRNVADMVQTYRTMSQQPSITHRNIEAPHVEGPDY